MPILECILIDASTDIIKLTANDMELGIETSIDGGNHRKRYHRAECQDILRNRKKTSDSEIVIETQGESQALITCEKAKFNIAAQPGDGFFLSSGSRKR